MNHCPTNLAEKPMARGYFNERTPGTLTFFNLRRHRIGNACSRNLAANFAKQWLSDSFPLTKESFKTELHEFSIAPSVVLSFYI